MLRMVEKLWYILRQTSGRCAESVGNEEVCPKPTGERSDGAPPRLASRCLQSANRRSKPIDDGR